ncbi:MAG TPA: glycosyltransferase family 2 protein [Bryobacteraceae bacterium]|jgi:cellulose synthase/poly-beta-1,6-N-acetylglucosamine synthase-like glycosyltransferase|nr:glycosyltransferase family 2 protein [Bryobacteraceae bacterium]
MYATSVLCFFLLAAILFYIVAGYPVLLAWLAARFPSPVIKGDTRRTVSFIIAVHNGERFLAAKLQSILGLDYPRELMQIIVVSDGSTDRTGEIAASFADSGVLLLVVPRAGKPQALNMAIPQATGEILVLTDVRQVLEPESVRRLVACFEDPKVGAASGDLIIRNSSVAGEQTVGMYWRYERWIRKNLGQVDSIFGATGPFYAIRRSLAVTIPPDSLLDDMYLPLSAFHRGYRLVVEESARAIDYPTGIGTEFGRKVRTLAGNFQILGHYPWLLTPRNRMLFHYLSYKVARLGLPWIVVLIGVDSFWLPRPWNLAALIPQAGFYICAAIDGWIPQGSAVKRITSLARTVVSLLAASVVAMRIFFVPPRDLWKPTQIHAAHKSSEL